MGAFGYTVVNEAITFFGDTVAGAIKLFKKRTELVNEIKDSEFEEVIGAALGSGKTAAEKIVDAIKA